MVQFRRAAVTACQSVGTMAEIVRSRLRIGESSDNSQLESNDLPASLHDLVDYDSCLLDIVFSCRVP